MNPNNEEFFMGRAVTSLQTMLRTVALCGEKLPVVIPDGVYGTQTAAAVTAFQRQNGLPATGVTDYETWRAIRKAYESALVEMSPAAPLEITMQPGQVILEGSDNLHVLLIQAMLHNLHLAFDNMPDCCLSGVCDGETGEAIRCLQRCCGMQPSGILNKELWQLLAGLYHQAVGDGERGKVCPSAPHQEP